MTLCSLWPTLINTAVGVASIDKDLLNVGRVLRLTWHDEDRQDRAAVGAAAHLHRPAPVARRRLDGADRRRNAGAESRASENSSGTSSRTASSASLAKIMVAVFTIGIIGFLLDRVMLALQAAFTHGATR